MVISITFQWIHIKKFRPVQADPGNGAIVKFPLHHIRIFCFPVQIVHPLIPYNHSDAGTALTVRRVIGQVIILGKPFIFSCGADPSREIHIPLYHGFPQVIQGTQILCIACLFYNAAHAGVHIHGPDGMSRNIPHLAHRHMVLGVIRSPVLPDIGSPSMALPSLLQEPLGLPEILCISGFMIKLYQRQLNFLVSRHPVLLSLPHLIAEVIRKPDCGAVKPVLSHRMLICDGRLNHMPQAIVLMPLHVRPSGLPVCAQNKVAHQIPVLLLCAADQVNPLVCLFFQFRIWFYRQRIRDALQNLVHIRIIKIISLKPTFHCSGGSLKIVDAFCVFTVPDTRGNGTFVIYRYFVFPEFAVNPDFGHFLRTQVTVCAHFSPPIVTFSLYGRVPSGDREIQTPYALRVSYINVKVNRNPGFGYFLP